ncbi:bifunctional MFS transporter/dTMP kinase [Amycolatopsis anabasis]|uniref:bifunctional MFS transporter/dTMP kinase n=1 Tax=Amycolatopsis anabasis TaxID=1840409 RepID=UPI00131D3DFE|nr:dTMP kinase [Amycolatopsis anabasis]
MNSPNKGLAERSPEKAGASTVYRARRVLAIRAFRRLWGVTYLCSIADWLAILGLVGLITKLSQGYTVQAFAFSGVVLTQLVPGLLFAPLGGILADRFDRRKIMIGCDLLRCGLMLSIALAGSPLWLFLGYFLVGLCSTMWIPAKDAAVPNLLRRPDQVETANQLGLVMTYGVAVITGAGLYALITSLDTTLHLPVPFTDLELAKIIVVVNGLLYLASAILVATRIPELSLRDVHPAPGAGTAAVREPGAGARGMVRDGLRFVRGTPLVRGLLIGAAGAFAAAGAVVGSALPYAVSLGGGDGTFAMLFVAVFLGLAGGMVLLPKLARRLPHERIFGLAIVVAGAALAVVAIAPVLAVALPAVAAVGAGAGGAFLTGVTIIGTRVDDAIRGRINALYQSLLKVILGLATIAVPLLVGWLHRPVLRLGGQEIAFDGSRPVLLGGALLATVLGLVAYRQMDSRRGQPILSDLRRVLTLRPPRTSGLLIAIEGTTTVDTAGQATRLAEWLSAGPRKVVLAADPALDDPRWRGLLSNRTLSGARARALAAAAVRAETVERAVRPALDSGAIVVMERFVDSPLAQWSAAAGLDLRDLEDLADWATSVLRPDLTVLLDTAGESAPRNEPRDSWTVPGLLAELAVANPDRYIVVDADGTADEVAERVRTGVRAALADLAGN